MKNEFLEAGQIVNTHGIQGELKMLSWCDSQEILCAIKTFYIDEKPFKVRSAKSCKGSCLVRLEGIDDINAAMCFKGKTVMVPRSSVPLEEGAHYLADIIGLQVVDAETGDKLGTLTDILSPSAQQVYVVNDGETDHLIPAVDEFVKSIDTEAGIMRVKLIEGL
ncbi:MAG: ribosome maturation factor RimM [Oscillospiraceae bacterium]